MIAPFFIVCYSVLHALPHGRRLMEDGMDAIASSIKETIAEQLGLDLCEVKDTATFDELMADNLDLIEIVMTVEDEFLIEISDAMVPNEGKTTVAEFIALIAQIKAAA
jgi:acyl carrier protein